MPNHHMRGTCEGYTAMTGLDFKKGLLLKESLRVVVAKGFGKVRRFAAYYVRY